MHVITYRRSSGEPVVMQTDADEARLRDYCRKLLDQGMASVVLHSLSEIGAITPVDQWIANGDVSIPLDEQLSDSGNVDDEHTYNAYCVKCKEKRDFHGEVVEMENGRRRAAGNCPVCGSGVSRILGNEKGEVVHPEPEWSDDDTDDESAPAEPEAEPVDDENREEEIREAHALNRESSNKGTHLTCACGEWDKWVTRKTERDGHAQHEKHVQEMIDADGDAEEKPNSVQLAVEFAVAESVEAGTPVGEVAEAVAEVAEEIANAGVEAENAKPAKAQPRKRGGKKANGNSGDVPPEVQGFQKVSTCPQCQTKQPVVERGGLDVFILHSGKGMDRCPGSTTVVAG